METDCPVPDSTLGQFRVSAAKLTTIPKSYAQGGRIAPNCGRVLDFLKLPGHLWTPR